MNRVSDDAGSAHSSSGYAGYGPHLPDIEHNPLEDGQPEARMFQIAQALLALARDKAVRAELPDITGVTGVCEQAVARKDPLTMESAIVNLYVSLHSAGSEYLSSERELLARKSGYSCFSGGISPLIMARPFIKTSSTVADLGAGNGLQGLLLQRLYPHRKTLQIELSSEMIRMGRIFQRALGIADESVEWIHDDITNVSLERADFIYLYRPARPSGSGLALYRDIAGKLASTRKAVVIFSVADCLSGFLDRSFSVFYTDGHLTCFSRK